MKKHTSKLTDTGSLHRPSIMVHQGVLEMRPLLGLMSLLLFAHVHAYVGPDHGFFMAVQNPSTLRSSDNVYLYAVHTKSVRTGDNIGIGKDDGSKAPNVGGGRRVMSETLNWGSYLSFRYHERERGTRYGSYAAEFTADAASPTSDATGYGLIRPRSSILSTNGVYTVTIWPATSGSTTPSADSDKYIGVSGSAQKFKLLWFKGNNRLGETGPRLDIKSTDDAGLYTIRRKGRGERRGAIVQIRVIAATCQYDEYWNGATCTPRTQECANGGVPLDTVDDCTCMPYFDRNAIPCDYQVDSVGERGIHVLGIVGSSHLQCHNLPGASFKCRGMLFCFGDLYGCKCANGWRGDNCNKPCKKGTWGANCILDCPITEPFCNRFVGPKIN